MQKKVHDHFLARAIELSIANVKNNTGGPFGAVIAKGDVLISEGVNLVTATNDPTAHAEMNAIRAACFSLSSFCLDGCTLYTSCEPCPMCLAAIYWAHLEDVYFANTKSQAASIGFDDSYIHDELCKARTKRSIRMHYCRMQNAEKAFSLWKKNSHKIEY